MIVGTDIRIPVAWHPGVVYRQRMAPFVPGLELARTFYREVVASLVPVPHTAALIGEGSEVLGYDTERSTDHEWGPRLQLFVPAAEVVSVAERVRCGLPAEHRGFPVRWFSLVEQRETDHIEIGALDDWLRDNLRSLPITASGDLDVAGWLAMPQQHLLQLTAGEVFRDDDGDLTRLRAGLEWYPTDVWRWLIACQWQAIGGAEPFLGRAAEIGDDRGARLITSRLCRMIMELAFLQERRYRPYEKWFGRAFDKLECAFELGSLLDDALAMAPVSTAGSALSRALLLMAHRHNELAISEPVSPVIGDFAVLVNDAVRPYPVLNTPDLINAAIDAIGDRSLRDLPRIGAIDQLTHADDILINFSGLQSELAGLYRRGLGNGSVG